MKKTFLAFPLVLLCSVLCPAQTMDKQISENHEQKLEQILKKTAEYCQQLNNMIFDFVCIEDIVEETNTYDKRRVNKQIKGTGNFSLVTELQLKRRKRNTYIYDFQMIKKDDQVEEKRILLKENGKKRYKENAEPKIQRFLFQNIVFGPAGFLSRYWQRYFNFEIIGEEILEGNKALIVSATPSEPREENYNFGKIWIDEKSCSIKKIEWMPESIQNFTPKVSSSAGELKRELTWSVTYGMEKNGIRFPSQQKIQETLMSQAGKKHPKSTVSITYTDYKFFTVEVSVKHKKSYSSDKI